MCRMKRWPRVFLSHHREDSETAERLRPLLKLAGFSPWADSASLATQPQRESALATAVGESDFVVALLSRHTPNGEQMGAAAAYEASGSSSGPRTPFLVRPRRSRTHTMAHSTPSFLSSSRVCTGRHEPLRFRLAPASHIALQARLAPWVFTCRSCCRRESFARRRSFSGEPDGSRAWVLPRNNERRRWNVESVLMLASDGLVVEDARTGRMWTRGCIEDLHALHTRAPTPGRQPGTVRISD